jgi:tRNA (cmo5U34)-methyltransferase
VTTPHTSRVPNSWVGVDQVNGYLARVDRMVHRVEGEAVLVSDLAGALPGRVLDLGCGDGRLGAVVLDAYPESALTAVDMSPPMLRAAAERFGDDPRVSLVSGDLEGPLPFGGPFDAVISSLAIHHVEDDRKRTLFREIARLLAPGGVFVNLEIVASPTQALHDRWREEMGAVDDPADRLCDMGSQLAWIAEAGLENVDCIWKWRSLALLRGERPRVPTA